MLILASTPDPTLPAAFVGLTVWSIIYAVAVFLIGCLILWFIIYSAVRAALTSHRRQMAAEAQAARGRTA